MKKKLMLISPMLHQGGFERVCVTTARLMEPYFDVTIVIFDSADIAYDVQGLHIIDIQMGAQSGKGRKILNIIRRSRKVKQLKKQMKTDIAYSFGLSANMVNAFSKTGKEKVWLGLRSYLDVKETMKIRLFMRQADSIICCSKTIENELKIKFGFNKSTTLYNPYDVKMIKEEAYSRNPELPWGEFDHEGRKIRCMISMGRDDDLKGFWHMLKAFALIHEKMPQTRLIIMGDGTFAEYKALAEKLKIANAIYFPGMCREPYPYLKMGEIYLLTSLTEGFPNALVEGMSLGLAPVSVNCMSGPAEILLEKNDTSLFEQQKKEGKTPVIYGEYGILLPMMSREKNLDPECILEEERNMADIVCKLLADDETLEKYQKAAWQRAQCFTYENYVEQILKLAE